MNILKPIQPRYRGVEQYGDQRVTVVILARDEAQTIGAAVQTALPYAHDVVVLDGHSVDATRREAEGAGATTYLDPGLGKGSAARMAIQVLNADILVFMDADGSHDPEDIPRLVMPIIENRADLVVGSRFSGGSEELSISVGQLIRTIGNISMNIAINARWNTQLSDTLNGFRAVRRAAAARIGLSENRHTIEQEMVMKMLRYGFRVINVPTHEYARQFGKSHIDIWREWHLFVWCVLKNIVYPGAVVTPLPPLTRKDDPQ